MLMTHNNNKCLKMDNAKEGFIMRHSINSQIHNYHNSTHKILCSLLFKFLRFGCVNLG